MILLDPKRVEKVLATPLPTLTSTRLERAMAESIIPEYDEVWKPIPSAPNYEVSNLGRVRSLNRAVAYVHRGRTCTRVWPTKILKTTIRTVKSTPYELFAWREMGRKSKTKGVHILVCGVFHGPKPFNGAHAAHFDGNSLNNRAENLRWATAKENAADDLRLGKKLRGEQCYNAKLTDSDVREIRRLVASGETHRYVAALFGVSPSNISSIIARKKWAHVETAP